MHSTALYIFLLFGLAKTCLVVNQVTCDCPYIPLATGFFELDNLPRDWNYTENAAMAPITTSSGCSLSMGCPEGYNLIIHDTNTSTMFGAYSAEGFCDSVSVMCSTQKWRVANQDGSSFSIFDRMYGLCVDFTKPRERYPTLDNDCFCLYTPIDNSNAKTRLGYHDYYVSHLSKYQLSKPKMEMSGVCPDSFDCGNLLTVLITDDKVYENPKGEYYCTARWYWKILTPSQEADHFFITCIDLSKPLVPLVTPKCNCKYEITSNETPKPWFLVSDQISEDRFIWNIYCFYATDLNVPNSGSEVGYIWQAKCNPKTNEWDMIWEPYQGKVYRNVPVFGFNCVSYR